MEKYAKKENIEMIFIDELLSDIIEEYNLTPYDKKIEFVLDSPDDVMLGPQVRHCLNQIKNIVDGRIPVEIIDMRDYGMMNGEKVLKRALELLDNEKV